MFNYSLFQRYSFNRKLSDLKRFVDVVTMVRCALMLLSSKVLSVAPVIGVCPDKWKTGMRLGELLASRWDDIDFKHS